MTTRHVGFWYLMYLLLLVAAIPIAISNLAQNHFAQAAMAVAGLAVGIAILITGEPQVPLVQLGGHNKQTVPLGETTEPDHPSIPIVHRRGKSGRLTGWVPMAIVAGFGATGIATVVLVGGYLVATWFAAPGASAPLLAHWFWALSHNSVITATSSTVLIAVILHFVAGVAWAVVYAGLVEPRLHGPGWRRGLMFAPLPWLLSLIVFLPAVGGGVFGLALAAGPLPILGNLIVHLAYGLTLGELYDPLADRLQTETGGADDIEEIRLMAHNQWTMALGIIAGLVLGGVIGWVGAAALAGSEATWLAPVVGLVVGGAIGALVGSFSGLSDARSSGAY